MNTWQWNIDGWIVLAGMMSACSCALAGNYLVLRRMSLMGDAISHAVLPGLAIAFILTGSRASLPMFVGAVLAGMLTAVCTQTIQRHGKVEHGAAMGVIFSVLFALGLIVIRQAADHVDLDPGCVLYGNISQIPVDALQGSVPSSIVSLMTVLAVEVAFVGLFYKELKISTFDPQLATTLGINADVMHYALMILVSIVTVANFEIVGSILVIAMLIVPATTAHLLTDRLGAMIGVSLLAAALSAVVGHLAAAVIPGMLGYDVSLNTSAMMAVVAGFFLLVAVVAAPQHGLIERALRGVRLNLSIIGDDVLGLLHRWQEMRPEEGRTMTRDELLKAIGNTAMSRWGVWLLRWRGLIDVTVGAGRPAPRLVRLSPAGEARARGVVRSHRLWESYIHRHYHVPPDHVHPSAERMEHFITPQMREEMSADLADTGRDPHGREIPEEKEPP